MKDGPNNSDPVHLDCTVADSGDSRPPLAISDASLGGTIHDLNRRYREQWDRAERLQDELDNIKSSRAFKLLSWWRRLTKSWRRVQRCETPRKQEFAAEFIDDCRVDATGRVSILIPFRNRLDLLKNCLASLHRTAYRAREVLLLDNDSTEPSVADFLEHVTADATVKVLPCPGPFNFARICNRGAAAADGDFLLFLNNDIEVIAADWLDHLLQLANAPGVGIVGATLLFPDGALQHAGIFPTPSGDWTHAYRGPPGSYVGANGELLHARTVPAVTGACLLIRRDLFLEMGGFDERYAVTLNDVDLCLRVRARGLKVAISPHARLYHFESLSRGFSRMPRLT